MLLQNSFFACDKGVFVERVLGQQPVGKIRCDQIRLTDKPEVLNDSPMQVRTIQMASIACMAGMNCGLF